MKTGRFFRIVAAMIGSVLLAGAFAALRPLDDRIGDSSVLGRMWSRGRGQGRGPVRLTHLPMAIEDIRQIVPMGMVVGAHVTPIDHMYFEPLDRNSGRFQYDVFVPADGYVVNVQHRIKLDGTSEAQREYDDWRVVIEHSGTFYTYYDLITKMDDEILGKLTAEGSQKLNYYGRVRVTAGQRLGKIGGRTLDFAVVDTETRLKGFIRPEHYQREPWKIHTVDPIEAFAEPIRTELQRLNPRQTPPHGGKIDYDMPGRLVGNWFLTGTNGYAGDGDPRGYWMGHLSFCYHHIDPSKVIISIGDFDGRPRQFMVNGNSPDPADISRQSGVVQYELIQPNIDSSGRVHRGTPRRFGTVRIELLDDTKLRFEVFVDQDASEVKRFTSAARIYER